MSAHGKTRSRLDGLGTAYSGIKARVAFDSGGVLPSDLRVLVVDDQRELAESLAALLQQRGYTVRTAYDGLAALEVLAEFPADCALLDLSMPRMDGVQLAQALRQLRGRDIVLIAITGRSELGVDAQEFAVVDHWLTKPIDLPTFYVIFPEVGPS
jgi:CheY-like chemotaxis protein